MSNITLFNIQKKYASYDYQSLINYTDSNSLWFRPYAYAFSHLSALTTHNTDTITKAKNLILMILETIPVFNIPICIAEHAMDSYFEKQCRIRNIESFLKTLNKHYKHISTNIESSSLSEIIAKARIIFLSEKHNNPRYAELHGYLINALWQPRSAILTECEFQASKVEPEHLKSQSSWDLNDIRGSAFLSCEELLIESVPLMKNLFEFFKGSNDNRKIIESYNQICMRLSLICSNLSLASSKQNLNMSVLDDSAIKELIIYWLDVYKETLFQRLNVELDSKYFYKRNESLISNILAKLTEGISYLFVIAGKNHLKYASRSYALSEDDRNIEDSAIDLIYNSLKSRGILFVHLQPRVNSCASSTEEDFDKWTPVVPKERVLVDPHEAYWKEFNTHIPSSLEECYQVFEEYCTQLWDIIDGKKTTTNMRVNATATAGWRFICRMLQEIEAHKTK